MGRTTRSAELATREAASNPWVRRLFRFGYAAKGFVYVVIGALAAQLAFGRGGATTGTEGAVRQVAGLPFGRALLALLAVGLVGYSLWRFVEAAADPEHREKDAKRVIHRIGYAISGAVYGALAWTAIRLATGSGGGGGGGGAQEWTARLMSQPFGMWLVGLAGAIFAAVGVYQFVKAWKASFEKKIHPTSERARSLTRKLGRFGLAARGVVFVLVGVFLIRAAVETRPQEARGLGESLSALAAQPYGTVLLAVVALGLVAYGLYQFAMARWRTIRTA